MKNYRKFMAQVNERIEKRGKKSTKSEGGIMARKERGADTDDYIAAIRKTTQRLKAKQNES